MKTKLLELFNVNITRVFFEFNQIMAYEIFIASKNSNEIFDSFVIEIVRVEKDIFCLKNFSLSISVMQIVKDNYENVIQFTRELLVYLEETIGDKE